MRTEEFLSYISTREYPEQVKFQFLDTGIQCNSNSSELIKILSTYYSEWKVDEFKQPKTVLNINTCEDKIIPLDNEFENFVEAGKTRTKEQFINLPEGKIVRKVKTGVQVVSLPTASFAHGPLVEFSNQVINYINALFIEQQLDENSMLFHAAAIQYKGRGIVIAAPSGKGKSTSALRLMNSGATFISNDRVIIRKTSTGYSIIGVPKHPRINPGTILSNKMLSSLIADRTKYEKMSRAELWKLEEKYDAIVPDLYGEHKFSLQEDFSDFLILDWDTKQEGQANITALTGAEFSKRDDLISAIMKVPTPMSPIAFEELKGVSKQDYLAFMNQIEVKVITGNVQDLSEVLS